jgi:low affinity Fe/Cu permease
MGSKRETDRCGFFERFAQAAARLTSHAPFFVACVGLVLLWLLSYPLFGSIDTWQLVINTATTIVTFPMVALLQNSQSRSEDALHQKLDAIADALADFMDASPDDSGDMRTDVDDLRKAVGIEQVKGRETASA